MLKIWGEVLKEAQYLYKCRHCCKVFGNAFSSPERATIHMINAYHNIYVNNQPPIEMQCVHECSNTKGGIADLIGFKIG